MIDTAAPAVPVVLLKGRNRVDATVTLTSPTTAVVEAGSNDAPVLVNGKPVRLRAYVTRDDVRPWHVEYMSMYRTDINFGLADASAAARDFAYSTVVDAVERVARVGMSDAVVRQARQEQDRAVRAVAEARKALDEALEAEALAIARLDSLLHP